MNNVNVPFIYIIPIILFWEKALEKVDNKPYTGVFFFVPKLKTWYNISNKRGRAFPLFFLCLFVRYV